ncbi:MBL fold metallo-hydrolase [Metabacillus rhizolycopersici]|uniref:MBL fold metallo-hydrolase n=1 Tax=Metabacillus rhizolycopersici TaxID=2875709 RepID=A0ABS7UVH2_9BACI|nr:MBL fold metallo-hydrolase [Metabacillus rhizolycopersici]MBZ5752239.1 MBL fold metallo-hydrolase [Metabacillus rhizolycopersici]
MEATIIYKKNYGVTIAAYKWDADLINSCDPEACSAEWLDQSVESYRVDIKLSDNDEIIHTGSRTLKVLYTPGHTLGHINGLRSASRDAFSLTKSGKLNIG